MGLGLLSDLVIFLFRLTRSLNQSFSPPPRLESIYLRNYCPRGVAGGGEVEHTQLVGCCPSWQGAAGLYTDTGERSRFLTGLLTDGENQQDFPLPEGTLLFSSLLGWQLVPPRRVFLHSLGFLWKRLSLFFSVN